MFDVSVIRKAILGETKWISCPACKGTGWENWNETGEDVLPGRSDDPERCDGPCETCDEVGFIMTPVSIK